MPPSYSSGLSIRSTVASNGVHLKAAASLADSGNEDIGTQKEIQEKKSTQLEEDEQRSIAQRRRWSVGAILASSFMNLLGFTMAGPITPALGKHFGLEVGASFGSLTSAYPLGMLFGLMMWPRLSDKIGRKKVMTFSLFGSGMGLLAQSMAVRREYPLMIFLATRVLTGTFAGSSPVSKAYLADVGFKEGKLPRYLALRDAASTMAFIVGPMLGGILYDLRRFFIGSGATAQAILLNESSGSLAFVIAVSGAASLLAATLVGSFVVDLQPSKDSAAKANKKNINTKPDQVDEDVIACPLGRRMWAGVATVCVVSFLFNIGDSTFHAFFSAVLRDGAGMSPGDIGLLYTMLACISFGVSTGGSSWMMKAWGPVATCTAGLACVASGLGALGLAASKAIPMFSPSFAVLAGCAAIYYCGVPLYGPTIPTMLLRCVPSHQRGAIMGLDGTINTIGRIISPLIMGEVFRRYGAGAAFGLAGSLVFSGALTAVFRRFVVLRDTYASTAKTSTN